VPEKEEDGAGKVFKSDGGIGSLAAIGRVDQTALSEGTINPTRSSHHKSPFEGQSKGGKRLNNLTHGST